VVLLGVTSFLLRRKEREPDEGEPAPDREAARADAEARSGERAGGRS